MSGKNNPPDYKEARIKASLQLAMQDVEAAKILAAADNHYAAYHCQQAAEKLLRAILLHLSIDPGIGHQLNVFIDELPNTNAWKAKVKWVDKYTPYATSFRYPTSGGRIKPAPDKKETVEDANRIMALINEAQDQLLNAQ